MVITDPYTSLYDAFVTKKMADSSRILEYFPSTVGKKSQQFHSFVDFNFWPGNPFTRSFSDLLSLLVRLS